MVEVLGSQVVYFREKVEFISEKFLCYSRLKHELKHKYLKTDSKSNKRFVFRTLLFNGPPLV